MPDVMQRIAGSSFLRRCWSYLFSLHISLVKIQQQGTGGVGLAMFQLKNCGGLLFPVEVLNFHYFRFLTSSCQQGHDDYYRVIFRRDVIPSLLIRSKVFLRHQLYEQTKKLYLFSYTVFLSDFDCFHLQYFLDNIIKKKEFMFLPIFFL